jgi:hypothetical protein
MEHTSELHIDSLSIVGAMQDFDGLAIDQVRNLNSDNA